MNTKVLSIIVIIITIMLLSIYGTSVLRKNQKQILQGEVDVTEYKISSKLAGRIDSLAVKVGDNVAKGDFIFAISTPEVDAKLQQAQAVKSAAMAQRNKADAGTRRQIIQSAFGLVKEAEIAVNFAQKSYDRIQALYVDNVVSLQQRDEVKAKLDVVKQKQKIAKAQYNMAVEGAQKEDKVAAEALVQRAQGAVNEVESYLSDALQYSPINGEISGIIAEPGELIATGYPVVTIVDIDNAWVSFNVREDLLPLMTKGKKINVFVPALNKNIELMVHSVSVQAQYATWTSTRAKGGFDIRTFEVKTYPTTPNKSIRPGMTVVYEFEDIK